MLHVRLRVNTDKFHEVYRFRSKLRNIVKKEVLLIYFKAYEFRKKFY